MKLLWGSELFVRTNSLGADTTFAVGNVVEVEGRRWRVTRHRVIPTTPWATVRVYGRPADSPHLTAGTIVPL